MNSLSEYEQLRTNIFSQVRLSASARTHTHTHTHTHMRAHACMHACMHKHTPTNPPTPTPHTGMHACTHAQTHTQQCMHARMHKHTHTHTRTHARTNTHTHTHTHTHTYLQSAKLHVHSLPLAVFKPSHHLDQLRKVAAPANNKAEQPVSRITGTTTTKKKKGWKKEIQSMHSQGVLAQHSKLEQTTGGLELIHWLKCISGGGGGCVTNDEHLHQFLLQYGKLAFRRMQKFRARLGCQATFLSCAFLSNQTFTYFQKGFFVKSWTFLSIKTGMFLEILGRTFFGNTFCETRAYCSSRPNRNSVNYVNALDENKKDDAVDCKTSLTCLTPYVICVQATSVSSNLYREQRE